METYTHKYTYTFKITPYKSWCYYIEDAQGTSIDDAKKVAREKFKQEHPEHPKFRITQVRDWRIGCSMYD